MELTPLMAVAALMVFAGASFFFALAETALFSLGKWQARQLAERKPHSGGMVLRLLAEPQDLLATLVLGNTFANAAMLAIALWMVLNSQWNSMLTLAALLVLILPVCEVLPKTMAVRQAATWSLRVARPMLFMQGFTRPLREIAQRLNTAILRAVVPQKRVGS